MTDVYLIRRSDGYRIVSIMYDRSSESWCFVNLSSGHVCKCRFSDLSEAYNDMVKQKQEGKIRDFKKIDNWEMNLSLDEERPEFKYSIKGWRYCCE